MKSKNRVFYNIQVFCNYMITKFRKIFGRGPSVDDTCNRILYVIYKYTLNVNYLLKNDNCWLLYPRKIFKIITKKNKNNISF